MEIVKSKPYVHWNNNSQQNRWVKTTITIDHVRINGFYLLRCCCYCCCSSRPKSTVWAQEPTNRWMWMKRNLHRLQLCNVKLHRISQSDIRVFFVKFFSCIDFFLLLKIGSHRLFPPRRNFEFLNCFLFIPFVNQNYRFCFDFHISFRLQKIWGFCHEVEILRQKKTFLTFA